MRRWLTAVRADVRLQARHGFYAASAFIVIVIGGLLLTIPTDARANHGLWVPALFVVNLPMTTLFFIAGLISLERDEGTLYALGVAPVTAGQYLALRMATLTLLAAVETLAVAWLAFGVGSWPLIIAGAAALGVFYTACGAGLSARYTSINQLILPGSVFVTFLLLPLLAHFGLASRRLFLIHPIEPSLTLVRASYTAASAADLAFGAVGSLLWCAAAWQWGTASIARAMRDTRATGGR
jgi:fluoroquinolone transport system permease protein